MNRSELHPSLWGRRFYAITAGVLVALNLMGPNGFIRWVLLRQESMRLEKRAAELQQEINAAQSEIRHFRSSRLARERVIREELGYLKADEVSVELNP